MRCFVVYPLAWTRVYRCKLCKKKKIFFFFLLCLNCQKGFTASDIQLRAAEPRSDTTNNCPKPHPVWKEKTCNFSLGEALALMWSQLPIKQSCSGTHTLRLYSTSVTSCRTQKQLHSADPRSAIVTKKQNKNKTGHHVKVCKINWLFTTERVDFFRAFQRGKAFNVRFTNIKDPPIMSADLSKHLYLKVILFIAEIKINM